MTIKKNKDYTHLSVILDRTGSMESIRDDVIGGFNAFLNQQKAQKGKATLTLVQFDSHDPYEVLNRFTPIEEIPELTRATYVPRATTPLLDAIGRGINDLEASISGLKKSARPSRVVMVIVTDGQENASHEFNRDQILRMIKQKSKDEDWQFVFLSADLDAISDASSVGFKGKSTLMFQKSARGTHDAFSSLSDKVMSYRSCNVGEFAFDEEDRKHEADPNRQKPKRKKKPEADTNMSLPL